MTVQSDTLKEKFTLDTPISQIITLNWELILYGIILLLAIATRFYDLGARVMSHDESLHTLYSWNLYAGKGYHHDPLMHGPFLFHINALMYFLFGDNDFTARISTALFGIILVILPYWFRPWLGRKGALATAFMILISPGLMYYSRYIRHDIFISVWTVLLYLAFFQFMRTRATRWVFIGAAAVAFMLSTKEVSYIHGYIGVSFIGAIFLWESLAKSKRQWLNYILFGLIFALIAGLTYTILQLDQSAVLPAEGQEQSFNPWDVIEILILAIGLLISLLLTQLGRDSSNRPVTFFLKSLPDSAFDIGKAVVAAGIIFVLLHTTFFTNIGGLYSGTAGEIIYWLNQQGVERGSQPWYYYLFLVPLYEFLPVTIGLIGGFVYLIRRKFPAHTDIPDEQKDDSSGYWASDGGTFAIFLIYWALIAIIVYSWAGEKMPWLTVHITLPLIFLAGHVIETVLGNFNWSAAWKKGGGLIGGAMLLLPAALIAIGTAQPFRSQSLQSIDDTTQFIAASIVLLILIAIIVYYGRQMSLALLWRTAFATLLLTLALLTVRYAWLFNFVNYDYVNEVMVYAHASPDVKLALNQIDDISRRTVGDKMIRVAYDNDSTWPLEWYMREYPNRVYYGENPTRDAMDSPVVIVGAANESKVKPYLEDDYTRFRYRLVWWPVEDYKNQSPQKLWETYIKGGSIPLEETTEQAEARLNTASENRRKLWNIIFYRDYEDYDLNEWPFVHRFFVYVRNDVLNEVWIHQPGELKNLLAQQETAASPYKNKRTEIDALTVWGSNGLGDGQFNAPRNVAIGPDGLIYVADSGNHRIQVLDQQGNPLLKWGSKGLETGQFDEPWGIAVGQDGTVYVADTWNHRIQAFSPTGEFLFTFGSYANVQHDAQAQPGTFWGPRDIAIDPTGNLYIADTGNKRIQKFSPDGQFLKAFGGGGIIPGSFEEPVGLDVDQQGNIYVADTWNRRIQKFDSNFNPLTQWDVIGWESESVVNKPYLTVDTQGRVLISDPESYRIVAYDGTTGEVLVTWGQYGQDLSTFKLPTGLDIDSEGNLLVVDSDNHRLMKFPIPSIAPPVSAEDGG